ncbi:MAG: 3-oxoacyl-ACP synthase [Anaerolinea sp.]|nr:3-oxoacyl-ACP synthase [Anaerolinea sp.]
MMINVGIVGVGTYVPEQIETAADLVAQTGIPEAVLRDKMGIRQRHVAGEQDTISYMASRASARALEDAGVPAEQVNLVISHGSEYKDHLVWNAASKIQHNIGAINAQAFEVYALCAGAPIALQTARGIMLGDESVRYALLTAASRENDLVNLRNERVRFMYNFGAGAGALLLERGATRNLLLGVSVITDGALSETVTLNRTPQALGTNPGEFGDLRGRLDVNQPDFMAERLGAVSLQNFVRVIRESVEKGSARLEDLRFLGITHMKGSFYREILSAVGLTPEQSVYLEDYGHIQSADQAFTLELGLKQGKIKPGDLIVLAGAGVGYTWSAAAIRWG